MLRWSWPGAHRAVGVVVGRRAATPPRQTCVVRARRVCASDRRPALAQPRQGRSCSVPTRRRSWRRVDELDPNERSPAARSARCAHLTRMRAGRPGGRRYGPVRRAVDGTSRAHGTPHPATAAPSLQISGSTRHQWLCASHEYRTFVRNMQCRSIQRNVLLRFTVEQFHVLPSTVGATPLQIRPRYDDHRLTLSVCVVGPSVRRSDGSWQSGWTVGSRLAAADSPGATVGAVVMFARVCVVASAAVGVVDDCLAETVVVVRE